MMEFRCLGHCRSDWRQEWERAVCANVERQARKA